MKRLLTILMMCTTLSVMAQQETANMIQNPMLWADVPDPDVIRVGDTFYLVSTTMHLMPGAPVMASKDLKNWETVGYIFDKLTDSPKYDLLEGTAYGRGQWATSLKYHKGKFYALLAPNEQGAMGDTYIFTADKAEGPWKIVSRMCHFHDCSLFFDDDDRVYVVYGTGEMMELKPDLSDVIEGTYQKIFEREADETGLLEGSRVIKHRGKYYLLMISHVYALAVIVARCATVPMISMVPTRRTSSSSLSSAASPTRHKARLSTVPTATGMALSSRIVVVWAVCSP